MDLIGAIVIRLSSAPPLTSNASQQSSRVRPIASRLPGFQIEQCLLGPIHRERHRVMHMCDEPTFVASTEAGCGAKPKFHLIAIDLGSSHALQSISIGDVAIDDDGAVERLRTNRTFSGSEPFFE